MVINVYCIYDKVAEEAGPLFQAVNDKIAMRQFKQLGIPESLQKDYSLHRIATYDSKSMEVVSEILYHITEETE